MLKPSSIAGTLFVSLLLHSFLLISQDLEDIFEDDTVYDKYVTATFKTSRLVNSHSLETVAKRNLDTRFTHRFDDVAGTVGGVHTLFGLDNVSDIRIAFEYGFTDEFTIGFGRSKGGSILRELLDGYLKYRLIQQTTDNKSPLAITLMANTSLSTMVASKDSTSVTSFPKFAHRISYVFQPIIGRKFSKNFSFQIMPTYVHRNFVSFDDENDFFAIGAGGRLKLTKRTAIIGEYYYLFSSFRTANNSGYFSPLAIGFEIETGGHVFHMNFTNSRGIIENQFLPYTQSSWLEGKFRFGFNISRVFYI